MRWFERFGKFNLHIKYLRGVEMVSADALSRSPSIQVKNVARKDNAETRKKVMILHKEENHQKSILKDIQKEGCKISNESREIVRNAIK